MRRSETRHHASPFRVMPMPSDDSATAVSQYEFDTEEQFMVFEQALENRVITVRERRAAENDQPAQGEVFTEEIATDMLDRAQRTRHGNRDGQPLTFEFQNNAELVVATTAALCAGRMTEEHGARGDADTSRVVRMVASMATEFEEMHPRDDLIDGIHVEMPGDDDDR